MIGEQPWKEAPLLHTDPGFMSRTESLVTELEKATSAELIVVAAPRSGSYRDLVVLASSVMGLLVIMLAVWTPIPFSAALIPLDFLVVAGLTWFIVNRSPVILRLLSSSARRKRQLREAAQAAFLDEVVHGTRSRTGMLIYVSALEGEVLLIPDLGVAGHVPGAEWNLVPTQARNLDEFLEVLKASGQILARFLPPEGDNPDEIPNAPRIRV